jgi:hypothetical protein
LIPMTTRLTPPASSTRNRLCFLKVSSHMPQQCANRLPNLLFVGCGGDFQYG